jgi:hypothetical protein
VSDLQKGLVRPSAPDDADDSGSGSETRSPSGSLPPPRTPVSSRSGTVTVAAPVADSVKGPDSDSAPSQESDVESNKLSGFKRQRSDVGGAPKRGKAVVKQKGSGRRAK